MKIKGDTFRFVAYLSPPPAKVGHGKFKDNLNYIDQKNYQTMVDCGFDRAIGLFEERTEHYLAGMKQAQKVGIDYLVRDQFKDGSIEGIIWDGEKTEPSEKALEKIESKIRERFDEYAKMPAYGGILASDEPSAALFTAIKKMQDYYEKTYPGKVFLVNLLPTYGNNEQLYGDMSFNGDYKKDYVQKFIDVVDPQILSFDHYALCFDLKTGENTMSPTQLLNLEVFAECARDSGLDYYVFLLTMGCLWFRTMKTYADIAWQVFSAMAYGAKGAQTFTYWTLLSDGEQEKIVSALVDREGNKTDAWYAMQEVISDVRGFEKEFMKSSWVGTFTVNGCKEENINFKELKHPLKDHPAIKSLSCDGDCIVGVFEREDGYALLPMNFIDPAKLQDITLDLGINATKATLCRGKERTEIGENSKIFLRAGEGVFVIIDKGDMR